MLRARMLSSICARSNLDRSVELIFLFQFTLLLFDPCNDLSQTFDRFLIVHRLLFHHLLELSSFHQHRAFFFLETRNHSHGFVCRRVLSLRIQQLDVQCETKSKDNVFVTVVASVQYRAHIETAEDAFYKLTNPREQSKSYIFDAKYSSPCCKQLM
ncbi:unnamed protein product [Sphagnum troendelagicum]|uniref:Uncharacterized protein n=1 Tax=Sphagnum troendelagicum TaxID=128251 RepID=A0ABP0UUR6_9BRYO